MKGLHRGFDSSDRYANSCCFYCSTSVCLLGNPITVGYIVRQAHASSVPAIIRLGWEDGAQTVTALLAAHCSQAVKSSCLQAHTTCQLGCCLMLILQQHPGWINWDQHDQHCIVVKQQQQHHRKNNQNKNNNNTTTTPPTTPHSTNHNVCSHKIREAPRPLHSRGQRRSSW